ncbi:hypothetical protein INT47_010771 [Mucor saturninus]|uniref:Uncharacterized protein n=1 Tax=Mucor saturninus TaxID=64648 RepID=A0A8H7R142_9FUNG|nr:hypothetical protein INT47_010771 [Mucor saturninus]
MNRLLKLEIQAVLGLCCADIGIIDIFVASDGNGYTAYELRSLTTVEYCVEARHKKSGKQEEITTIEANIPTDQNLRLSIYEQHLQYYSTLLEVLLRFENGRFTDLRFVDYQGRQRMDNGLCHIANTFLLVRHSTSSLICQTEIRFHNRSCNGRLAAEASSNPIKDPVIEWIKDNALEVPGMGHLALYISYNS